jgi:hypothetical protein
MSAEDSGEQPNLFEHPVPDVDAHHADNGDNALSKLARAKDYGAMSREFVRLGATAEFGKWNVVEGAKESMLGVVSGLAEVIDESSPEFVSDHIKGKHKRLSRESLMVGVYFAKIGLMPQIKQKDGATAERFFSSLSEVLTDDRAELEIFVRSQWEGMERNHPRRFAVMNTARERFKEMVHHSRKGTEQSVDDAIRDWSNEDLIIDTAMILPYYMAMNMEMYRMEKGGRQRAGAAGDLWEMFDETATDDDEIAINERGQQDKK